MSSQADFTKIKNIVVKTMERHWSAEFDQELIEDYCRSLGRYDDATLKKAMQSLIDEQKRKPTIAHIVEACKKAIPAHSGGGGNSSDENMPWVIAAKKIEKLVTTYVDQYRNVSQTYSDARREGWDLDLMRYVSDVATIQAHMISREGKIGWNSQTLFGAGTMVTEPMRYNFFKEQERLCAGGSIDVSLPTDRIADWKSSAAARARPEPKKDTTAPNQVTAAEKTALDVEIERQMGGADPMPGRMKLPEIQF